MGNSIKKWEIHGNSIENMNHSLKIITLEKVNCIHKETHRTMTLCRSFQGPEKPQETSLAPDQPGKKVPAAKSPTAILAQRTPTPMAQ